MLYFSADPRDGGPNGAVCGACCCQSIAMKPGETNLMTLNYAPWSVPIGTLITGFEYEVETNTDACATNEIDTFTPPVNTEYRFIMQVNDPTLTLDLTPNAGPASNVRTYSIVPLSGPGNGRISSFNANGTLDYTPNASFNGFDYFSYKMVDRQGRSIVRNVQIAVLQDRNNFANANDPQPNVARMSTVPYVITSRVKVDAVNHLVKVPLYMPMTCRDCEVFTMTIRQKAQDCDKNVYTNDMCFDFRCKDC